MYLLYETQHDVFSIKIIKKPLKKVKNIPMKTFKCLTLMLFYLFIIQYL